ncbi:MAG: aspartyl protease family protein [Candidatus Azotimanducaceae bacterium]|jgi:aspartyl protease family protein
MPDDIFAQATYLVLLGLLLSAGLWTRSRKNLSQTAQHAAIWVLIFIAAIGAFGLWGDIERHLGSQSTDGNSITVPVSRDGHYYLRLAVNDVPIDFVIDTGATDIVLNKQDAQRVGIDVVTLSFYGRAETANGTVETANIALETIQIGDVVDRNVRAVVSGGEMFGSLLGMGYLQRWGRIEIANDVLSLTR